MTFLSACWAQYSREEYGMNLELLDWSILAPAVVAGLIKIKEAKLGKWQACTLTHLSAERIGWEILGD